MTLPEAECTLLQLPRCLLNPYIDAKKRILLQREPRKGPLSASACDTALPRWRESRKHPKLNRRVQHQTVQPWLKDENQWKRSDGRLELITSQEAVVVVKTGQKFLSADSPLHFLSAHKDHLFTEGYCCPLYSIRYFGALRKCRSHLNSPSNQSHQPRRLSSTVFVTNLSYSSILNLLSFIQFFTLLPGVESIIRCKCTEIGYLQWLRAIFPRILKIVSEPSTSKTRQPTLLTWLILQKHHWIIYRPYTLLLAQFPFLQSPSLSTLSILASQIPMWSHQYACRP